MTGSSVSYASARRAGSLAFALAFALLSPACEPDLEVGEGGSQCFSAFEFNKPVTSSVVFDGQRCPDPFANCAVADSDWPVSTVVGTYMGSVDVTTLVAHYRIGPPPPTTSDLYLVFHASDADIDDIARISVALSPSATATAGRTVVIQPFAFAAPATPAEKNQAVASTTGYQWNGAAWVAWGLPGTAVSAEAAYKQSSRFWSVEVRLHLPDFGITGPQFYMATRWRSEPDPGVFGAVELWTPASAEGTLGADQPTGDPLDWTRYSFGTNCAPDVWIASQWNTCADMYINARNADQRKIGIDNVNDFHAVVHGDADVGQPELGGVTANGVLVYMDITHLGNGDLPWAMNYPHTDANIRWEGATNSLATAVPEPPTPFSVAAGATNDDVRVQWKPADEPANPFSAGQHVCTNAYVYFKDDPNFDNNFGQCNMQFVQAVAGRQMDFGFGMGSGFRREGREQITELVIVPLIVNSGLRLTAANELGFRLQGEGVKQVDSLTYRVSLPMSGRTSARMSIIVPEKIFSAPSSDALARGAERRLTRQFYGDRPLIILQSFVPVETTVGRQRITVLRPASYLGLALER